MINDEKDLRKTEERYYDAILMDMRMPEMDGPGRRRAESN